MRRMCIRLASEAMSTRPCSPSSSRRLCCALDHLLILEKSRGDLTIELLGCLKLVLPVAVRRRPQVEAAGLGLRCQTVEQPELEAEVALRVVGCGASIGGTPLQDRVWRNEFEFLTAVDAALEAGRLHIARRR